MRRVVRRLGWSVIVVWAVVSLTFVVGNVLPGDPARMVAGAQARPADVARIRDQLGLNHPPLVQYALFWRRILHAGPRLGSTPPPTGGSAPVLSAPAPPGHESCAEIVPLGGASIHVDLGKSYQQRQPVVTLIATRLPRTFALAAAGLILQLLFGVATGVLAAARRGRWLDRAILGGSLLGVSAPTFLIALALQYVFAHELRWLPLDGFGKTFAEHARSIVLPALTLGVYGAAYYTRLVRDEMGGLLAQDWIRTARAKGASPIRVLVRHGLRNAVLPIATAAGLDFGALMGGAIVTETVFRWPGIGDLAVKATLSHDGPIVLACTIVSSVAVVGANIVVDALHARLDPRLRSA
jgi:peptide/nickel transport system permease protein